MNIDESNGGNGGKLKELEGTITVLVEEEGEKIAEVSITGVYVDVSGMIGVESSGILEVKM